MTRDAAPPTPISLQVRQLVDGRRSLSEEVERLKQRAGDAQALNPIAWVDWPRVERLAAEAHRQATQLGAQALAARPLLGVFVSVKDLFQLKGAPMTAGTRARLPDVGEQSTVVERLEAAGAIVFAKTQMHEIALGATGENVWTGDVCNAIDPSRQAGGSSSGSAVAVACGIGAASIGSDTGGSVRIPAAFNALVGFKPTFGAIPLDGALALSWTCDHAGPLTRSVGDAASLYEVLSGRNARHGAVPRRPRLGVPRRWLAGRLAPAVRAHFERLLADLAVSADIVDADPVSMPLAWQFYTPIVRAEGAFVHRVALAAGGQGFSAPVLAPLQAGLALSAATYFEAMAARARFTADLAAHLAGVDALILPTTAIAPPLRGQTDADVEGGRMTVREAVLGQTLPFSFAGVPTLTVPSGFVDTPGRRPGRSGAVADRPSGRRPPGR